MRAPSTLHTCDRCSALGPLPPWECRRRTWQVALTFDIDPHADQPLKLGCAKDGADSSRSLPGRVGAPPKRALHRDAIRRWRWRGTGAAERIARARAPLPEAMQPRQEVMPRQPPALGSRRLSTWVGRCLSCHGQRDLAVVSAAESSTRHQSGANLWGGVLRLGLKGALGPAGRASMRTPERLQLRVG